MPDDLRTRIAAIRDEHEGPYSDDGSVSQCECGWRGRTPQESYKDHFADVLIRELGLEGSAEPARLQERLDNIGRWLHPGLWGTLDGRRGIFLRILAGEQIDPPESARSTDWEGRR